MENFQRILKKAVLAPALVMFLLTATLFAVTPPIMAQGYMNMQEGGSIPLPKGVTPDYTVETQACLSFRPNPVGVGQPVLVNAWIIPPVHVSRYLSNLTIVVTKPDGTQMVFTRKSYRGDTTTWLEFTPDTPGTWKIKFIFPGAYFPAGNYTVMSGALGVVGQVVEFKNSCYYAPSSDGPYDLIVQEEPVPSWPPSSLPIDYWERPVYPENREWWNISGWYPPWGIVAKEDWPWPDKTNKYVQSIYRYVPFVEAPESAHIVWKRQVTIGGLIGGPFEQRSWTRGGGGPSIIYAGLCYQTLSKILSDKEATVLQCYDLRTGEILWERSVTYSPSFLTWFEGLPEVPGAQPQMHFGAGVYLTYVGGGRVVFYDPWTGFLRYDVSISPLTTGTFYANYDTPYFLTVQDKGPAAGPNRYRLINWTIAIRPGPGFTVVPYFNVVRNITWPFGTLGSAVDYETGVSVFVSALSNPGTGTSIDANITAVDIYSGRVLWSTKAGVQFNVWPSETIADHGKVAVRFDDGHFYCWDLRTGKFLWKSEHSSWPWGIFGAYGISSYGGKIIVGQYDGVAAYDWNTGKLVWLYQAKAEYPYETVYQDNYPFFAGSPLIADGKVYLYNCEHTPTQPLTRGWKLHCIDAETGAGLWSISGMAWQGGGIMGVADGYLAFSSSYDGYLYVFGKSKSTTSVFVSGDVIPKGSTVLIKGTVLDAAPAQPGTPCVAKESMSEWMEFLHMQRPEPSGVKGVPVNIYAIYPDGTSHHIGTAITDPKAGGVYSMAWNPPMEGIYTIIAIFEGDESYGSSSAGTTLLVTAAPPEAPPAATPEQVATLEAKIEALNPLITALIAIVIICLCLVLYDIYMNHKTLKQAAK